MIGLDLEPAVEQKPSDSVTLLGASARIEGSPIVASLPEKKRRGNVALLRGVLGRKSLSPAEAVKVRGKLGFAQYLVFGKFGRALLREFPARQYSKTQGPRFPPSIELGGGALKWWADWMPVAVPRSVRMRPPPPVVVYTDDEGTGRIAAVLFDGTQTPEFAPHAHARRWMFDPSVLAGIFEFAILAICLGAELAILKLPGRPILLCAENQGQMGAAVRGTCCTPIGRALSSYLWKIAANTSSLI